jgi:hypothetical protein
MGGGHSHEYVIDHSQNHRVPLPFPQQMNAAPGGTLSGAHLWKDFDDLANGLRITRINWGNRELRLPTERG